MLLCLCDVCTAISEFSVHLSVSFMTRKQKDLLLTNGSAVLYLKSQINHAGS